MNNAKSLKIAMAMRGLNQAQLAQIAGVTQPSISGCAKRKLWNGETLVRICKALEMKVSVFVALGEE